MNVAPKVFDNASPLDPQLFSSMRGYAGELLGTASGNNAGVTNGAFTIDTGVQKTMYYQVVFGS